MTLKLSCGKCKTIQPFCIYLSVLVLTIYAPAMLATTVIGIKASAT
jgi:uncharacterized membrane protein (DUF485 family)